MERRWLLRLVAPVGGALAVGLFAATSLGAADAAWQPPACTGGLEKLADGARLAGPDAAADLADEAWFTLDPRLDAAGALAGQELRIGAGAERTRFVELPPESSAAGPFGRVVLVAADDGRRSEVRAIDDRAGCGWIVATVPDVVRRVTLDPVAAALYEHRVDRRTRADLGIWRRPLDGSRPQRVLDPLPADPLFGVTFSTTLAWSAESDRLVVQSCGAVRCRTRLFDPETLGVVGLRGADQGELVGVVDGQAVGYAACVALPCPLVATDVATGRRVVIDESATLARLVATPDGPRVAVEDGTADGTIRIARLDGGFEQTVHLADPTLHVVPGVDRAAAGTRLPAGWLLAAPDGRSPEGAVLIRLADGATVGIREVAR